MFDDYSPSVHLFESGCKTCQIEAPVRVVRGMTHPPHPLPLNETEENKPAGTRTVYTIDRWRGEVEPDGTILIGAYSVEGAVIWLASFPQSEWYEVVVDGPDEPRGGRSYRGGPGSLAHDRFERFKAAYEHHFGPLDAPPSSGDTDPRQDE